MTTTTNSNSYSEFNSSQAHDVQTEMSHNHGVEQRNTVADNTQTQAFQDFGFSSNPQETFTSQVPPIQSADIPQYTPVSPQTQASAMPVSTSGTSQPSATADLSKSQRKKTIMSVAAGFIGAAILITPTTWMIASQSAHNSNSLSSQNFQGGPSMGSMNGQNNSNSMNGAPNSSNNSNNSNNNSNGSNGGQMGQMGQPGQRGNSDSDSSNDIPTQATRVTRTRTVQTRILTTLRHRARTFL
ncbi:hypothetical protein ACFQY8_00425 [Alloscardovia venturai]|uniref:Ethanolamine utilization protein EutL n=1 Tax=Alloscardovia venturai TaxID=1769421 RepID=A0ABW2Y352_9BIFI